MREALRLYSLGRRGSLRRVPSLSLRRFVGDYAQSGLSPKVGMPPYMHNCGIYASLCTTVGTYASLCTTVGMYPRCAPWWVCTLGVHHGGCYPGTMVGVLPGHHGGCVTWAPWWVCYPGTMVGREPSVLPWWVGSPLFSHGRYVPGVVGWGMYSGW